MVYLQVHFKISSSYLQALFRSSGSHHALFKLSSSSPQALIKVSSCSLQGLFKVSSSSLEAPFKLSERRAFLERSQSILSILRAAHTQSYSQSTKYFVLFILYYKYQKISLQLEGVQFQPVAKKKVPASVNSQTN